MTGFEPWISGVGSDCFTNCATTSFTNGFELRPSADRIDCATTTTDLYRK